jgi:dTMP kinase
MFIAFEGFEGLGKSTHVRRLAQLLRVCGNEVVESKEPGGTTVGNAVRALLLNPQHQGMTALCEFLLFQASRAQLIETVIRPALADKKVVVLDRYTMSSAAYQIIGRGLPIASCLSAIELATGGLIPDVTFLLTGSYETAIRRVRNRLGPHDRIEAEAEEFHRKVLAGYDAISRLLPWQIVRVDAEPSEEDVFTEVVKYLSGQYRERLQLAGVA